MACGGTASCMTKMLTKVINDCNAVSDVEPDCRTDDDCVEGEICVTVGNFGVAECVDGKYQCMEITC